MQHRSVTKHHVPVKCGPDVYYIHFGPRNERPGACIVMRDPKTIQEALDKDFDVVLVDRRCGFCGGPTPCLKD
tara:strand:+ start:9116 stop:9334 length:219 start_codon:yes stop_codon:yes gene_type:complete